MLSYTIHIGPYLQIKPLIIKQEKLSINGYYLNRLCSTYDKLSGDNYCSICGTRLTKKVITETIDPDFCKLIGERLIDITPYIDITKEYKYFVPNIHWDENEIVSVDPKTETIIDEFVESKTQDQMNKFEIFFKKEIQIIKENSEFIAIKYGVINTIS